MSFSTKFFELSDRMLQLIYRAMAEGSINEKKAVELSFKKVNDKLF